MADPHTISILRQADRNVVEVFVQVAKANDVDSIKVNAGAAGTFNVSTSEEFSQEVQKLMQADLSVIETASIPIKGFNVTFHRGGRGKQAPDRSPYYDDVAFQVNEQQCGLTEAQRLDIITLIAGGLEPVDPKRSVGSSVSEEQNQLWAVHNSTLERLEKVNEQLIRDSEEFRRKLESEYQARADALEKKHQERSDQLQEEHDAKERELEKREEELRKKIKEVDDRQNTHVRRELRQNILEEIRARAQDMRLTRSTSRLRWPIHAVCVALMSLLGTGAVYYAIETSQIVGVEGITMVALIALVVKQAVLSVGFGAISVFYLRWLNSWFFKHAENEFSLRQLQIDVERASWVVETAFEWKDAKGSSIPNELLQPISKGLFSQDNGTQENTHPADELASALLGTASGVRLKVGDSEINLDGKKLAKMKRDE
mgnify:CR=1 FL=1